MTDYNPLLNDVNQKDWTLKYVSIFILDSFSTISLKSKSFRILPKGKLSY